MSSIQDGIFSPINQVLNGIGAMFLPKEQKEAKFNLSRMQPPQQYNAPTLSPKQALVQSSPGVFTPDVVAKMSDYTINNALEAQNRYADRKRKEAEASAQAENIRQNRINMANSLIYRPPAIVGQLEQLENLKNSIQGSDYRVKFA